MAFRSGHYVSPGSLFLLSLGSPTKEAELHHDHGELDDVGWGDLGSYGGGENRGCLTPHLDRMAAEGMRFTNYYGQASCTAGRASFITGRIPIRTALSTVLAPGDLNGLQKEDPTIAEALKQLGYQTVQWGKWHLGDRPENFPTEHGFDEMKYMLPYYAGVYAYDYLPLQPDFPNQQQGLYGGLEPD